MIKINYENLDAVNKFLLDPKNPLIINIIKILDKYGGVKEINLKAEEAGRIENLIARLKRKNSPYVKDIEWLIEQRDKGAFISLPDYRRKVLGEKYESTGFDDSFSICLEISACNFFEWLIEEAKKAIEEGSLMPARYIRVRTMKEQVDDDDILAFAAAMKVIGASYVQTLDSKGTMLDSNGQPINIHLGGPNTITGYFGGVGAPNEYALEWVNEYLHYHINYGIKEVLNTNPGTVILGYILFKMGININFKISVFMGNDNPYSCLSTLLTAKLFSRENGSTPLTGFNLSNSINSRTIELSAYIRKALNLEDFVRIEHHITETWKSIVRQPYDRLDELIEVADRVKNISAKHEGGTPDVEATRPHPSDILEYFLSKREILERGLMPKLLINYLDKHDALNRTAMKSTMNGLHVLAAQNLHKNV
jgi:hypothetical protein